MCQYPGPSVLVAGHGPKGSYGEYRISKPELRIATPSGKGDREVDYGWDCRAPRSSRRMVRSVALWRSS